MVDVEKGHLIVLLPHNEKDLRRCGGELAHLGLNVVHKGLNAGSEKQG